MIDHATQFKNAPQIIVSLINKLLLLLIERQFSTEIKASLAESLSDIESHPKTPIHDIIISFSTEDITYTIVYSTYKIEVSDYVSVNMGEGYDHYQQYCFKYNLDGEIEETGSIYELESVFITALQSVATSDISISDEE